MFTWLLYNTLCALPLAALALLASRARRSRPGLEHFLWWLVLVRLVLPPFAFGGAAPAASVGVISSAPPNLGDEVVAALTRSLGTNWSTWGARVLLVAFLAALAWVVARELARARAVEHCVRRARPAEGELVRHVRSLARELGVRAPRVRVSDEAASPFLWSLRSPVLVLPAADELPEPTVLAHELAHLSRRDHWTAWLELLVQGFHFWNPLFWLARRRLHFAAELACDRCVVQRFPEKRRAFASALIDTAERAAQQSFVPRAVQAIGMDRRGFEERLLCILRGEAGGPSSRGVLAASLACACLTLPGAMPTLTEFRQALPELPDGMDEQLWRDSLASAEAALANEPENGAALQQQGLALMGLGRTEEALAVFQHQEKIPFQSARALYNQACAHVRLAQAELALECLLRAADLGLDVAALAAVDTDLDELREHHDFVALFGH